MESGVKLISESYRQQNALLHESPVKFGHRGDRWVSTCEKLLKKYGGETVLDYGAGKADLERAAPFPVISYDPAIEQYSADPKPCDIVLCTDVLEHIEPEYLENVLKHIRSKTLKAGHFSINTREDRSKLLPDGTNPHKIIENGKWWSRRVKNHFTVVREITKGVHYECEVI